jgi:hypothetical protein
MFDMYRFNPTMLNNMEVKGLGQVIISNCFTTLEILSESTYTNWETYGEYETSTRQQYYTSTYISVPSMKTDNSNMLGYKVL